LLNLSSFLSISPSQPQSVSSQETLGGRKSSVSAPRALGQLFILLQYQTPAQRIKVMVRKAENLAKLTRIPGAPGKNSFFVTALCNMYVMCVMIWNNKLLSTTLWIVMLVLFVIFLFARSLQTCCHVWLSYICILYPALFNRTMLIV